MLPSTGTNSVFRTQAPDKSEWKSLCGRKVGLTRSGLASAAVSCFVKTNFSGPGNERHLPPLPNNPSTTFAPASQVPSESRGFPSPALFRKYYRTIRSRFRVRSIFRVAARNWRQQGFDHRSSGPLAWIARTKRAAAIVPTESQTARH